MHWVTGIEKDPGIATLEKRLWGSAVQFRANSGLKPQKHSDTILCVVINDLALVSVSAFASESDLVESAKTMCATDEYQTVEAR